MDFAKKQLEKYGWSEGEGLGKHGNGISQPLKAKLKRSVAGIGHDPASEFTEHWWSALYNKAASNVEVKDKGGKTKKIKTKDDSEFEISNSTWKINKKKKEKGEEQYGDYFVKKSILTNGEVRVEKIGESESEEEEVEQKIVSKLTDEELFAACGGRTAHKGARHGLKALGKLARIEQQEKELLIQPQYEGYSHAKKKNKAYKSQINNIEIESMTLNSDSEPVESKRKKNKRKRCMSNSSHIDLAVKEDNSSSTCDIIKKNGDAIKENHVKIIKKDKKLKRHKEKKNYEKIDSDNLDKDNLNSDIDVESNKNDFEKIAIIKKKKRKTDCMDSVENIDKHTGLKSSKNKKCKD